MKRYLVPTILMFCFSIFFFTGFQCSSSEMTSAKLYIQRSDWTSAERSLEKEVAKNPNNAEAWYLLGQTRAQLGKFQSMLEALDASLKISNEYQKQIDNTRGYAWGQSLNQGVNLFNKSISSSGDSASMFRQQAIENYKLAIQIFPDSTISYRNLAIAFHSMEMYDEEISTLKKALAIKPSPAFDTLLAIAYQKKTNQYLIKAEAAEVKGNKEESVGYYNDAIATITEARKTNPNDEELLNSMINIYVKLDRANEAKPFIIEALQRDPSNKVFQYNLGVLLMQTDSLDEAITHFQAALESDPNYDVALQNIAVTEMQIGDKLKREAQAEGLKETTDKVYLDHFKKAAEYFERLVALKPDDPNYWDNLASAYANANYIQKAKEALEKADELRNKQ